MTKDEIIEMSRQAGAHDNVHKVRFVEPKYLERFAKLVASKEREACAQLCAEDASGRDSGGYYAEIIRDRSNT